MGLRFDPIGGGQFKQALKQIIDAESQPIKTLEARKGRQESKLKLFQDFKGKFQSIDKSLGDLNGFQKFRELKADLGDGSSVASVTIDKDKAQPGSYQIQVDTLAQRTSVISNGFENPDEPVLGLGFVVMKLANGDAAEVFVDEAQSSLRGVASLINAEAQSPIQAAVIKDSASEESPWKLILTAKKDGKENAVEFPEFYFMDGSQDFYIDDDHEAQNAVVQLNGFRIEQGSNDLNDFLPGVNLHLKQAKPEQPFTLTISQDTQKISGKLKGLVDKLNDVLQFIVKQNQVDESSDTRSTFAGDSGLQTIEYRLRNLMHEGYYAGQKENGEPRLVFLSDLGVEFDKAGSLTFKEEKFQKTLEKSFDQVSEAVSGQFGFAFQLKEVLNGYTQVGTGLLIQREQALRGQIKEIDRQIDDKTKRLDARQQSLVEKFSRLEASLGNLQRQQQYLSATLPSGGGGNLVQQLLGGG